MPQADDNLPYFPSPPLVPKPGPNAGGSGHGWWEPEKPSKPKKTSLIHDSFPGMGEEHRAHEGSQSETPTKEL
jgi:hypothetical protein